jgi:hypothetical protein
MPGGMLARTAGPADGSAELGNGQAGIESNGESRGDIPMSRPRRRRRSLPAGKVSGRKFQLPDAVFERLQLHAIKKRTSPSAVVADILDRELPQHKITTDD